jgi:hypothetical protein
MHHSNVDSLLNTISSSRQPIDFQIKILFLISKKDLIKSIKEWLPYKYSLSFLEENDNIFTIKITRKIKKDYSISGIFNLIKYDNIYVAITHEKQDFVKDVLIRFFENYYSETSRLHLTSGQIQSILDKVKEKLDCDIITDRVISYSRINKRKIVIPGKSPRSKESDLRWTEEDYKISFRRAAENDQWIDKITFYTQREGKILFHASLSREGLMKCNKNIKEFYNIITKYLIDIGQRNINIFSNKSRLENDGEIKPLTIEYQSNVFDNIEQNKKLIKVISEFPKSSYSIYHGNPYLHMSLVDYADGSSYDLWVVSNDKLIIVPQIRATFNSLSRLCEHILKRFLEGKISELKV